MDGQRPDAERKSAEDRRIDALWATLDAGRAGSIDVRDLKRGLRAMDHRKCSPLMSYILSLAQS